ncbi:MAG: succinylglutamate desuccinylase [Rhodospirillaceae bacterium]|jgi:predicted deacylase|nr:succinylglutamate desuccinylase [Rhodospirillaceae bacterium]MBT4690748.1 succinylglutamate desuccinylase [Rhodospirillaceae bacterium]MBT5078955.1 succinylglutamate desuccinylase [Rhodospirillaceae bacterium]MBT5522964.1 succinylglutamate desuccinylase [Rhodospirillaceae bacterium]MBT5880337.1 succinylglutamate desuccinylase [Rhodospirillaceae bacterium]
MRDKYQPKLELLPIDIRGYRAGNTGIDYVHRFSSGKPGPNALINALTHGNEVCGAHALAALFENDIRPNRGTLTLSFANVDAYHSFDMDNPGASRFVDEDFNRLWSDEILGGTRQSSELTRARQIQPVVADADFLLDLHSMHLPCPALMLSGTAAKGRRLANAMAVPEYVVADPGHAAGPRLRDYNAFAETRAEQTALLIECGQHWAADTGAVAVHAVFHFLDALGLIETEAAAPFLAAHPPAQQMIEVVGPITIQTEAFRFSDDYNGLEVIPKAGTIIGHDGAQPVLTPHDDCVLIMPTHRPRPGQTAVRLGKFID